MKTTQLKLKNGEMILNKETVKHVLCFDEVEYGSILLEKGCEFLARVYGWYSPEYIRHSRSKLFWNWYRLQFDEVAKSYLRRLSTFRGRVPRSILAAMFMNDIAFFCVKSNAVKKSFENYLYVEKRYGKRSGKAVQGSAASNR